MVMNVSPMTLAEDPTPPGRARRISRTVSYYVAFVALGMVAAAVGPTLPDLAENTRTRLSEISVIFTTHSLGYLIGSFQGGRLYDRVAEPAPAVWSYPG